VAFFSEMVLKKLCRNRITWHEMRVDDVEGGEPDLPPALLFETQVLRGLVLLSTSAIPNSL